MWRKALSVDRIPYDGPRHVEKIYRQLALDYPDIEEKTIRRILSAFFSNHLLGYAMRRAFFIIIRGVGSLRITKEERSHIKAKQYEKLLQQKIAHDNYMKKIDVRMKILRHYNKVFIEQQEKGEKPIHITEFLKIHYPDIDPNKIYLKTEGEWVPRMKEYKEGTAEFCRKLVHNYNKHLFEKYKRYASGIAYQKTFDPPLIEIDTPLPFGKHKGKTPRDLFKIRRQGYLTFLANRGYLKLGNSIIEHFGKY